MTGQHDVDRRRVEKTLLQKLESLQQAGVRYVPRSPPAESPATPDPASPEVTKAKAQGQPAHGSSLFGTPLADQPQLSLEERRSQLDVVRREVAGCTRCAELVANRSQTVFGTGSPTARLCFFGEGPGADEDRLGEPFVGKAGQLLDKIIAACTLKREDVHILNVVKCRPPGNRNPTTDEAENCRCFYERQFEIIQPEFICCLGAVAATNLLDTSQSVGKLRGRFHDYRGARVLVTYHPAYLLRNPSAKGAVWEDMQLLMREMGIPLPTHSEG